MEVSEAEARDAALRLWVSWRNKSSIESGLRADVEGMPVAIAAAADITFIQNERRFPNGKQMDALAPTPWHCACVLLAAAMMSRTSKRKFDDDDAFANFYGFRAVFRGQARPWPLSPTAWRDRRPMHRAVDALWQYINSITGSDDAPEFELFGRLRSTGDATALGQHYGIPTNLLDFTFDPLAAVFFALSDCASGRGTTREMDDHAVVLTTSLDDILRTSGASFAFPPVQASRLFRQAGFFVDCGEPPASQNSASQSRNLASSIEEKCARVFFPRSYPIDACVPNILAEYLLPADPFFHEVAQAALVFSETSPAVDVIDFMGRTISSRPPWFVGAIDGGGLYTDDDVLELGRIIEQYLVMASLVHTTDGPAYDPVVLGFIARDDDRIRRAIHELSQITGSSLVALESSANQIRRALVELENAQKRYQDRNP